MGVPTGLADLTGEFRPAGFYPITARSSVGKTAMMLTCALAAIRAGTPALVFSLEMSRRELVRWYFSMLSGVNLKRLRGGHRLNPGEVADLILALPG